MDRQQGSSDDIRKKRLRRRNFILAVFNLPKKLWNWIFSNLTFKKGVVIYCLLFIFGATLYMWWCDRNDFYYNSEVMIALIKAHVGELGLTALSSLDVLKHKDKNDEYKGEDYG